MKKFLLSIIAVFLFVTSMMAQTWVAGGGPFGGNINDIVYHASSDKVFALGQNGLFVSPNGSNLAWTYIPLPAPNGDNINDLYIDGTGNIFVLSTTALLKSTDAGATFTVLNPSSPFAGGIRFGITSSYYVVLGTDAGSNKIWRSPTGVTWSKASTALSGNAFDMVVSHDKILVSEFNGQLMERSDDFGDNWNPKTNGGTLGNIRSLSISADGSRVYCVTDTNPYESTNDGNLWTTILYGLTTPLGGSTSSFLAADGTNLYFIDNQNHALFTKLQASGITWNPVVAAPNFITAGGFAGVAVGGIAIKDANNIFFATKSFGVLKTSNGGGTIGASNTGLVGMNYTSVVTANSNLVVGSGAGVFLSTDQGANWTKPSTLAGNVNPNQFTVFKATNGTIVAIGGGFTYTSVNDGANWATGAASPNNAFSFASYNGTIIYGYNSSQIFISVNQGATWTTAIAPTPSMGGFQINKLVVDQNNNAYAFQNNVTSIYKIVPNSLVTPSSATDTQIQLSGYGIFGIQDINYLNNKVYVLGYPSGNGRILAYTSDQGTNWTAKAAPNCTRLDVDPINNYLLFTNNNGSNYFIFISRDDGTTYTTPSTLNINPTRTQAYGAIVDPSGIAYALFSNFGIYKTTSTVVTPIAPSALTNSGASTDRITLRWTDNATSETYFVVQKFNGVSYDSVGGYNNSLSATGKKGFVEITGLSPNTSYQFQVAAANSAGKSAFATLTTSTTVAAAATVPDNKSWTGTVTGGTLTNVVIKALGGGFYSISDVSNLATTNPVNIPATFIESNGGIYMSPTNNTGHLWSNSTGTWNGTNNITFTWTTDASATNQVTATVNLTKNGSDPTPAAPSNTTAYVYNNTGIEIRWVGSAFETDYIIERSNGASFTTVNQTFNVSYPITRYIDNTALVVGNSYSYHVKAHNGTALPGGNTSAASNDASVQLTKPYFTLTNTPNTNTLVSTTSTVTSTGATWGDFNNDGFDDLIMPQLTAFSNVAALPLIFRNNGAGDFTLVTSSSGMDLSYYLVATAGDYDNDGNLDVFITSSGSQNYLYQGHGDFTFTKIVSPITENIPNSFQSGADLSCAWVDYNNDGMLDLYVMPNKDTHTGKLFTQGPLGTFTKASSGLLSTLAVNTTSLVWADYDNDGDQDVFVMNQNTGSPNQLLRNNGGGTFVAVAGLPFSGDLSPGNGGPQGAAWGDYDNDGFLDLYVGTYQATSNLLYKNNNGVFTKITSFSTTVTEVKGASVTSAGPAWGDINNDGFLDLVVSNVGGENQLYINNNGTGFVKISNEKFNDIKIYNFGAAFSDYNNDGFLDLAVSTVDPSIFNGGSAAVGGVKNQFFKNNNSTGNWVEFKLRGTLSNRSAIGARVTLNASNATHQIREISSSSTFGSQGSQVVHFGLGANTITSVQIKWPSGVVMTLDNIAVNTINSVTEDGAAPAVTLLNPLNAATNVAVTTPLELTFNEVPVPVASKKISVFVHGSSTALFSVNVTTGTILGNKISFTPPAALGFLTQYDVVVDAGAFTDIYGNATPATINWSFTTVDNVAPVFAAFTPIAFLNKGATPANYAVGVTDNSGTVSSVTLSYRKISTKAFTSLAGTLNATTLKWEFAVQTSFFDEMGMHYYFTAKDPANNTSTLPAAAGKYFITRIKYAGTSAPAVTLVKGTGNVAGYQIISIPWDISNKDIASNFEELGGGDNTKYRFLKYHESPAPGWDEYPGSLSSFARGEGYFINQTVTNTITLQDGDAPRENRDSLFQISLNKGWNQIGNPYLTAIQWNDVLAYNNITSGVGKLVLFGGSKYNAAADPGVLQPFLGGFVLADNPVANLKIPFQGQLSGGRTIQYDLTGEIADDSWQVSFGLRQGDLEFAMGSVGMSPNATTGKDIFDMAVPPRLSDEFIEMSVAHPEFFMKRLSGDIVNTQGNYSWEFSIGSNTQGVATLSWDNTKFGTNRKDLYLLDVTQQKVIDMRETSSYNFDPSTSDKIKIIFGDNLKDSVKPERVYLGNASPNPSSGVSIIPFGLPENGGNYSVKLEVYDMLGRKVSTLANGELKPGFYQTEWNTIESNLNNGLYIYRLVVTSEGKNEAQSGKIILKK